jgi:hypothetical protein
LASRQRTALAARFVWSELPEITSKSIRAHDRANASRL